MITYHSKHYLDMLHLSFHKLMTWSKKKKKKEHFFFNQIVLDFHAVMRYEMP